MSRKPIPAEAFSHGDARRYRRGCRCQPCTKAVTAEVRRGRYLRATGRGRVTTPQRAARHIEQLRAAGMSDLDIMSDSLLCPDTLYGIVNGARNVHRSTEARILAVKPRASGYAGPGAHVPALGTVRRLRALAADGWTAAELGRRAGKHKQFIVALQQYNDDAQVRRWVADYVRTLYTELADQKPEDAGISAALARLTRERAAGKGWISRAYWDAEDFDDPDFTPALEDDLKQIDVVAENAAWLLADGLHPDIAAKRIGRSRFYLDRALREARQKQTAA